MPVDHVGATLGRWTGSRRFLKTELELGHCLRPSQEGPCECDLSLTRAKFVTTPAYAPRLRARRLRELELVEDAAARGWPREVERHQCAAARIEQLPAELGERVEQPTAVAEHRVPGQWAGQ